MKASRAWLLVTAVVFIGIARWNLLVAFGLTWVGILVCGVVWRLGWRRRAEQEIRTALHRRTGPFFDVDHIKHNFVFRILVRQYGGAQRIVWAEWGRYSFGHPDKLDLRQENGLNY
jgi:hypothetical protein